MKPSGLDRKLFRDLRRMLGQAVAVSLVIACGLGMMIMARSLIHSLDSTRARYYETNRFADVFAALKRAPSSLSARIAEIPGVEKVQTGVTARVTLDLIGLDEPASGIMRSLPDVGEPDLNVLFLRAGRWLVPGRRGEVLVGEAFADANALHPGDALSFLLNGRRVELRVAGIVLSPEYIFESRPGAALPDNRTFGIFWMPYRELASAFDLYGAFNNVALTLTPGTNEQSVIQNLDALLATYGGRGAYGRSEHPSHIRVSDEIGVLKTLSVGFPVVFLSVAAFMTNSVLSRLLALQREQIAILKAFGYTNASIVLHYLKFAFAMVAAGTVFGGIGGVLLGGRLVSMYHAFFRFPSLEFQLDGSAVVIALVVSAAAAAAGVMGAVRRAAGVPPAEAMRPEPPANHRRALVERTGLARFLSHTFRIAMRNLERRPMQALFTVAGLALATAILVVPSALRDSVSLILGFQWDAKQRQDLIVGLVEPSGQDAVHALRRLPGVVSVEPFRNAGVRIHFGERHRQMGIQGLPAQSEHSRAIGFGHRQIELTDGGIAVSAKLAQALGARLGNALLVESLEGKRLSRQVVLIGLVDDSAGLNGYMEIGALNRLLGEGDIVTGASFVIDSNSRGAFLSALKSTPRVGAVAIKETLRDNFRKTTAASINVLQSVYLVLAIIVATGVVYNNARISLAERARELATLRVIGFTRGEVGAVLITELVALALLAVPLGLAIGTAITAALIGQVSTETVRLPLVFTTSNYAIAVLVVTLASCASAVVVLRKLERLDLVGALKAPE